MTLDEVRDPLNAFIRETIGSERSLANLKESDGHAGLTFLFDVQHGAVVEGRYVLKVPPRGVTRRGNTDVFRQAPLLRALHAGGLKVPDIPWAEEENVWFDVPFIIMERLSGDVFFVWDPHQRFSRQQEQTTELWHQCLAALPDLHHFDWQRNLAEWQEPQSPETLIHHWDNVLPQAAEQEWKDEGLRAREALLANLPTDDPIGLFHGDYQPGNVLYDGAMKLSGIIDWELSGIGGTLIDLGWIMMLGESDIWIDPTWRPIHAPTPAETRSQYESLMGQTFPSLEWHEAYACFRMGCIGGINVKLHRKGQRHDPIWEHMVPSVLPAFRRVSELLLA
ncbi:MAG: phosphotransferase family protein [Pseudomonadota bacterium]